jgi:hypothetical protein
MSRIVSTELPAFCLLMLGLKDGQAERAALAGAGVRHYIKGNALHQDRDNVYVIEKEQLTEDVKDMLATLMVPLVVHVDSNRATDTGFKSDDYKPSGTMTGQWVAAPKDASVGFHIKGRNFCLV